MSSVPNTISGTVILAGGLKPSPLCRACDAPVLTIPLSARGSLQDHWLESISLLGDLVAPDATTSLCVSVEHAPSLQSATPALPTRCSVVPDQAPYRGPAGVLRDAAAGFPDGATILVAESSRIVATPLRPFVQHHFSQNADVTVGVNPDGAPAGIFLIRAGTLSVVPAVGFMDLKEQLLSKLVKTCKVLVWKFPAPGLYPCRTRTEFLNAALAMHRENPADDAHSPASPGPAVLHESAIVDPTAYVAQCVLGRNSRVGAGAVLVRSIVMPGASVHTGASISDAVITTGAVHTDIE